MTEGVTEGMTDAAVAEVGEDYARAGFGRRLGFGTRPVLLVVDMVNAYLDPASPLYAGVESALAATVRLVDAARTAHTAVLFTKVYYEDGLRDGGTFFRKAAGLSLYVGETELGEVAAPLGRRADEPLLRKQFASAFFATGLDAELRRGRIDTVLIAGLSTSGCVRATAVDAVQYGYVPVVVADAVGDRAAGPHDASLFDLDAKYADVVSLDEALNYLSDGHPEATDTEGLGKSWQ